MWIRVLLGTLVLCWLTGAASAQVPRPPGPQFIEKDRRLSGLFQRAQGLLVAGRHDEALAAFEDLYRQAPRPVLLYYLAKLAQLQQRSDAAIDLFNRFAEGAGDEMEPEFRGEVQQALGNRGATSEVTVQGDSGAMLYVDERLVGVLPLDAPLLLFPGTHRLMLEKSRRKVNTQVSLVARRRAEVRFTVMPPLAVVTLTPGVLLMSAPGDIDAGLVAPVRKAVADAAATRNAVLVSAETLNEILNQHPELASCQERPSCLDNVARQAAAQFVLRLSVRSEAKPGRPVPTAKSLPSFRVHAELVDIEVGAVSVQADQTCVDCQVPRLLQQLGEMVTDLLQQGLTRPRGTLAIDSNPTGAAVEIDGRAMGATPLVRDAFVGQHELLLNLSGYEALRTSTGVEDGQTKKLTLDLRPLPEPVATGLRPAQVLKWVFLGTGLVGLVAGGSLLGLNASGSCPAASCGSYRSGGIAMLSIGIASIGVSGFLFYYDRKKPAASPPSASLSSSDFALLRF